MKSCDFYEELWLLWNVATLMKSCDFYEKLQFLWKVVTFMESCDFYERWRPFWKIVTFPKVCDLSGKAQQEHFRTTLYIFYKLRDFLSF